MTIRMKHHAALWLAFFGAAESAQAQGGQKVEKKDITVISAGSSADGSSQVRTELVSDCILSLPNPDNLEAQITSEAMHLKEINGEPGKNEWAKVYRARLDVNYLVYQKELLIVTTRSVKGQEPVIKEVEKKLRKTESFLSNPSEGDVYAGRSNRQYYYTKPEMAVKDVKSRAKVWVQQQSSVVCPDKK